MRFISSPAIKDIRASYANWGEQAAADGYKVHLAGERSRKRNRQRQD